MKIYGYSCDDKTETLLELSNVGICFENIEEAQKFADFANECVGEMKSLGEEYDHIHFAGGETPDITIERLVNDES